MARRIVMLVAATSLLLLGAPGGAQAKVTKGPCDGTLTIKKVTYTPNNDTRDNPILIVDEPGLLMRYFGTTGVPIKNHRGKIGVKIGPFLVTVANWSNPNPEGDLDAEGPYNLDTAWEEIGFHLVGIYRIEGQHTGDGGECEGYAYIKIEGNPLTTPVGAAASLLGLLSAIGVALAGRVKKAVGS